MLTFPVVKGELWPEKKCTSEVVPFNASGGLPQMLHVDGVNWKEFFLIYSRDLIGTNELLCMHMCSDV